MPSIPAQLNISAFKFPLGFIRIIQFVFIIIAIAAINSWGLELNYHCVDGTGNITRNSTQKVYTFSLSKVKLTGCDNQTRTFWSGDDSASGSAGFFYFVNVTALIYVIFICFVYVIFWNIYQTEKRIPLVDLGATALLFILFFFCSSIWWAGANTIGNATSDERLTELFGQGSWKGQNAQFLSRDVNNGKLAISVLANWVCVLCFAFNCWFIWKEVVPRDSSNPSDIA
ncbi:MARVEL domain-containing protein [Caenorhabditis elegans]|uniref:MARVEL domain-containing protein n=1 Tax=Caenorhabditis elegans TaxID=6239 RepID=O44511_CAEEL|nr:MARVEL domain-containing protein [Caenorhabditis elegans]CCD61410.1 MARVEL domain-containing protein [Caenorhabditis elegans]|eukprot:NP_501360.2 SynaptoPHysin [Caenorhabditis elegans]